MKKEKIIQPSCQQMINSFPWPYVIVDENYTICMANQAYMEHYGWADPVGSKCHQVSHHHDQPCSQHGEHCPLEEVFASREQTQVMHVHYDKQGNEERVQLTATPLFDDQQQIQFMGEAISVLAPELEERPLVGQSPAIIRTLSLLQRVAKTKTTVLIQGESGVGKECAVEYLHQFSNRRAMPLMVLDCAALSQNLIETELFGHDQRAFDGTHQKKTGLFQAANGGTLLIDEVGNLPMELQTKLLRVLETGKIRPLGETRYFDVDVRVVAASNKDLQSEVKAGRFREDLYYRLSAFPVRIPPLRARKDDIAALAEHFLQSIPDAERHLPLSVNVISKLMSYNYPGNVRELRNVLQRAVILCGENQLTEADILFDADQHSEVGQIAADSWSNQAQCRDNNYLSKRGSIPDQQTLMQVLNKHQGHRARVAKELGVSERTLYRYLKEIKAN